jgi:hypothetical protein
MTADTRTTERTEARVETVTVEEVQCPVCQQWYADGDKLTVVGVGVDYEPSEGVVESDHLTRVCTSCAASLFDLEVSASGGRLTRIKGALAEPITDLGGIEVPTHVIKPLVSLGIGLAVAGIVANSVMTEMATQLDAADVQEVGAPLPFLELLPILLLVIVARAVLSFPRLGRFR